MNRHTSIALFSDSVKDDILKRIMNDHAPTNEEAFDDVLGDIAHEEIDEAVTYCYNDELMILVKEFGFFEAVALYCNTFGDVPALWKTGREKTYRVLLYTIVYEKCHPSWSDYNRYVVDGDAPLEEDKDFLQMRSYVLLAGAKVEKRGNLVWVILRDDENWVENKSFLRDNAFDYASYRKDNIWRFGDNPNYGCFTFWKD